MSEISNAMNWVLENKRSKASAQVLLEAALEGTPKFLPTSQVFTYAFEMHLYEFAERVIQYPEFEANRLCLFPLIGRRSGGHWDYPLQDAVTHNQVMFVKRLTDRGPTLMRTLTLAC